MSADRLFIRGSEIEREFTPDMLVILGRSIEFTIDNGRMKFRPTGIFSKWDPATRDLIPEINFNKRSDGNNKDTYVSGGNSNVLAAVHYLRGLSMRGKYVKEIVFAAGRPPYLQKLSDNLTEGDVMLDRFNRLAKHYSLPVVPVVNYRKNKNTWDDVRETIKYAEEKGYKNIAMISIGLHLPRIAEFIKEAEKCDGSEDQFKFSLFDSWEILSEANSHYKKMFESVEKSEAYKKTVEMEERGLRDFKNGTYKLDK